MVNVSRKWNNMCEWNGSSNSQRKAEVSGRTTLGKFHKKYQQSQPGYLHTQHLAYGTVT